MHPNWLNQAEIYLSVVQREVVTPNDFADLDTLEQHSARTQSISENWRVIFRGGVATRRR